MYHRLDNFTGLQIAIYHCNISLIHILVFFFCIFFAYPFSYDNLCYDVRLLKTENGMDRARIADVMRALFGDSDENQDNMKLSLALIKGKTIL